MTFYVDTSALVSLLTTELPTPRVQRWFAARDHERFLISDWVETEFSSALSLKIRAGKMTADIRRSVIDAFGRIRRDSFDVAAVLGVDFRTATRFAGRHELGLRGGDALHLAVCEHHGATLCTLDQKMNDAAVSLGIASLML